MHRHVTLTLSVMAAFAAGVCAAPVAARAAQPLPNTIVINPSSGCGLLTAYTAGTVWPAWSGPAPSCGAGALTLAFNQGKTPPPPLSRGVALPGSALLAWSSSWVPEGARTGYRITAPAGMTINRVDYDPSRLQNIADGYGWIGFTYSNSGTAPVHSPGTAVDAAASGPLNTPYWGIELRCVQSMCVWPGEIQLSQITVVAAEAQGPSITPVADPGSLWNQIGHWIWNKPGDAWPLPVAATDPSGVCTLGLQVGTSPSLADSSLPPPNNSSWQECQQPAGWTAAVDTNTYVSAVGQLPVTLRATNAAGPLTQTSMSETLDVDNDPVSVSLSTPNDPNPTVWTNHAVTVDAAPSAGPSGLGGMNCGVNGPATQSYPAGGLTVDGDGIKSVSCTAWNNAVDPQGNHNSGTSSVAVHIDEAPPSISFEPAGPADPTSLVADTSDTESGVASGSIEMAPAGTNQWTSLPTAFDGSQLAAHFNDAGLTGVWQFAARACDNVGNCASTTRTLALPVRDGATAKVSLQSTMNRCAVGKHLTAHRAHRLRPAAAARSPRPISDRSGPAPVSAGSAVLLPASRSVERSPEPRRPHIHHRARTRHARRQRPNVAAAAISAPTTSCGPSVNPTSSGEVAFGSPVTVRGRLTDSQGQPLAGQAMSILTAPDNGSNAFAAMATVVTGKNGNWSATLPAGASRIVEASYSGSATMLPASARVTVVVPAKIEITHVTPDRAPWGGRVRLTGRVLGGYIPASSKLLRLDLGIVGIPGLSKIQGIPNVSPDGTFTTTYKFARYQGVVRFWLQVSSLAEADFPFAPARSRRVIVTVGVRARTIHHGAAAQPSTASRPCGPTTASRSKRLAARVRRASRTSRRRTRRSRWHESRAPRCPAGR